MNNGTRYPLKGIYVDGDVTWPRNSTWARNPVPRQGEFSAGAMRPNKTSTAGYTEFSPPCPWDCSGQPNCPNPGTADHPGTQENYAGCSGDWRGGQIVDTVRIPADIEPGQWVLGFRWDCEVCFAIPSNKLVAYQATSSVPVHALILVRISPRLTDYCFC